MKNKNINQKEENAKIQWKIDVSQIKNIPEAQEEIETTKDLQIDLNDQGDIAEPFSFKGTIKNEGKQLFLYGNMKVKLNLFCSRCLKPIDYDMSFNITEVFTNKEDILEEDEDAEIYAYSGNYIDIAPIAVSSLWVNMPLKVLCEKDCQGLCSQCGQNINKASCDCKDDDIDPRLEVLKKLLD